jgi:cell division protein FtsN
MSRDYAKSKSANNSHHATRWSWLLMGVILATLIITILLNLGAIEKWTLAFVHPAPQHEISTKQPIYSAKAAPTIPPASPKFEFYRTLTKNGEKPESSAKIPENNPKISENSRKILFTVQIASVRKFADADRLKARLALLGFNATIQRAQIKNQTWYRVIMSSSSKHQARQLKQSLAKQHIKAIVLRNST